MRFVGGLIGRLLGWALVLALLLAVLVPLGVLGAAVQTAPFVPETDVLTPDEAARSRAFVNRVRRASRASEGEQTIAATEAELDAVLAAGARLWPGLRGRTDITPQRLMLELSAPLPAGGLWANFRLMLGPTAAPIPNLMQLRLGRVCFGVTAAQCRGAALVFSDETGLALARRTLDLLTPSDAGTLLFESLRRMEMSPGRVVAVVDGGGRGDASLVSRLTRGAREALGLEAGDRARAHYAVMAEAAARGELPRSGSALPWLRFAVQRVADAGHESGRAARRDLRAAILAYAAHCGGLGPVETMAGEIADAGRSACEGTTLRGRDDLRKHFSLSAAFAAAGSSSVSWGLGEVKELVDAGREGGSGFSFDDVALDRAGIRLAERLRRARPGEIGALAAALDGEAAVTPSIEGLPSFMSAAEFRARYGGVEDPRYARQLAEIDARIAALPFHSM